MPTPQYPQRGFTYLGLLILVALIGMTATATLQLGAVVARRDAEAELLAIGEEFRAAFLSYANATPAGQTRYPARLEELLKDTRFPRPVRHLRRIYVDPVSGKEEWGVVEAPGGNGIIGVYSLAEGRPIKTANFKSHDLDLVGKTSYRDWKFTLPADALTPAGPLAARQE
ncbi:type II secretory pathway pseudopilin PulG [Crenobacter luteus]|uniref:type II secretion system protein n=1 Tax=Crenobacter luteus TaxID=1452487 RepID=UPI00104948D7|nr:type II secretion system protein [Crenobacter luteus]TCP10607.1 type II secretory pathway pseudopilin PulG [Crenobacter luteus]